MIQKIADFEAEAYRLRVELDINTGLRNIKIWGLPGAALRMSDLISKKFKDMEKAQTAEKEEHLLAKHIEWRYSGGAGGRWVEFGFRTNKVGYS